MNALLFALFALVVLAAASFAAWPVLRGTQGRARLLLAASLTLFVAGIGAGAYLTIGRPALALRTLEGRNARDKGGAVADDVRHVRARPNEVRGWRQLGRDYLDANDGENAVKAFIRAIEVARATNRQDPGAYSDYGMALASISPRGVPQEAVDAFRFALSLDPKDRLALFFLGQAALEHGDAAQAAQLWQTLIALLPPESKYHRMLVDRVAGIEARTGAAPDIGAMVAGLAQRLKTRPDDPEGWQRLVRAYAVLGDREKAKAALADARAVLSANTQALKALAAEEKELGL